MTTNASDIQDFSGLEKRVFERVYSKSLASQICSLQKMRTPTDYFYSFYSEHQTKNDVDSSSFIFVVLDNSFVFSVGSTLSSSSGGSFLVKYAERNNLLLQPLSGTTISEGDTLSDGTNKGVVEKISKNMSSIIFAFSNFFDSSEVTAPNEINLRVDRIKGKAITKKIRTEITKEVFDDIKFLYPNDFEDILEKNISQVVADEIDRNILTTLKDISSIIPTLIIDSANVNVAGYQDIPGMLFANLSIDIMNLNSKVNRGLSFDIILSPKIAGYLLSSIQSAVSKDERTTDRNVKFIGTISGYNCYVDNFANEDYYMILFNNKNFGDATMIFGQYKDSMYWETDYETGKEILFYLSRTCLTRNPQDTGTGLNDSIFSVYRKVIIE